MYMRGVIFIAVLALAAAVSGSEGAELKGEYRGALGTEGAEHQLKLEFAHQRGDWLEMNVGGECRLADHEFALQPNWNVALCFPAQVRLVWNRGCPHHTSSDLFRLIQKENFSECSSSLMILSDQIELGLLRNIPFRTGDSGALWFCQNLLSAGPLLFRAIHLNSLGRADAVSARVLQVEGELGPWRGAAGFGRQENPEGVSARACAVQAAQKSKYWWADLLWQKIEPGFLSLAAKTNKFTPDRKGWHLQAGCTLGGWEASLNCRRHSNLRQTRRYDQFSFKLKLSAIGISAERRLQPTQALILRWGRGDRLIQIDALNGTVRCDWGYPRGGWGLRFDIPRRIGRLEVNLKWGIAWRFIVKYDWLQKRGHRFISLRRSVERGSLQLELGSYDRGNLLAGFGNPPRLCISWVCKF